MVNVNSTPLDALLPFYKTLRDGNGTLLNAWTDDTGKVIPVWAKRMKGDGVVDALPGKQYTHILRPQVVLTAFSSQRASAGDRWTSYPVQIGYYDFDYDTACTRATLLTGVFDQWKGHNGAALFEIPATTNLPGWTAQLWDVANLQVTGPLNEEDPRLWKAVVNLFFRNFDPI